MQIPQSSCLAGSGGFHWSRADAYLFDIDGTLINTRDATHYDAFHSAVREVFQMEPRIDGVPLHGNTDVGILRAVLRRGGLSEAEFEAKLPAALEHMCQEVGRNSAHIHPELCPSIQQLLERLQGEGKLLGVVSGNLERIGWLKLQAAKLRRFFAFGCFSDQHELREDIFRLGIDEARSRLGRDAAVCVVGDTPADILAARKSGMSVIAVATGIFKLEDLLAHQPDACFACCTELLAEPG